MTTRPTVLILGAGASAPFGFPLGRGLLLRVVGGIRRKESNPYERLLACGFPGDHILNFADELDVSMQLSVDAFLENRPEFLDVGKAAIVAALIPYEAESNLNRSPDKPHWYEYLFQRLCPNRKEFESSTLSIITFNYDRSLEHFLFRSLRSSFGLSDKDCKPLLQTVPVVHVHGQLGALDYISSDGRPYQPDLSPQVIKKYAQEIKIVSEGKPDTPQFARAHEIISRAGVIFFLGFGYHKNNVERLHLDKAKKTTKVFGCVYGMTGAEAEEKEQNFKIHFVFARVGGGSEDVLTFLRNYPAYL